MADDTNLAHTIGEPANGTRLVLETASGDLIPLWRDEKSATDAPRVQAGEHWFVSGSPEPVRWETALRDAVRLHALIPYVGNGRGAIPQAVFSRTA